MSHQTPEAVIPFQQKSNLYGKVEDLWYKKKPCTPGGNYYTEVMQSEMLVC